MRHDQLGSVESRIDIIRAFLLAALGLLVAIVMAEYFISGRNARSATARAYCGECSTSSPSLSRAQEHAPGRTIVKETDECVAMQVPGAERSLHYVIVPKARIADMADVSAGDQPYLVSCLKLIGQLVDENKLSDFDVKVNGTGEHVHFHLLSPRLERNRIAL